MMGGNQCIPLLKGIKKSNQKTVKYQRKTLKTVRNGSSLKIVCTTLIGGYKNYPLD